MLKVDHTSDVARFTGRLVRDFDGQTGRITGEADTDGETIVARIIGDNFARWSDTLDLELIDPYQALGLDYHAIINRDIP